MQPDVLTIRVVASSREENPGREIALRLRSAAVEVVSLSRRRERPETCQAIAFFGPIPIEKDEVEEWLLAGKHVLLAAEPCWPADVLETLLKTARRAGVQLAIVNPDRYLPSRQLVKQQIPGKLGAPGLVRIHRWEPPLAEGSASPLELPGALLRDIDLALWLIDRSPNRVFAVAHPANARDGSTVGFVQVHLGFAEGMALIDFSRRLPPGDGYQSLSVIASTGAAYCDDHQNMQLVYRGGSPRAVRTGEGIVQRTALVQDFIDALAAGQNLSAAVTTWRAVFRVADAVHQSLASRQAVPLEALK